jgi:hypothetical protein
MFNLKIADLRLGGACQGAIEDTAMTGCDMGDAFPRLRLVALCETGTRALLGAVFGTTAVGEGTYAARLLPLLNTDMLLLADRGFDVRRQSQSGDDGRVVSFRGSVRFDHVMPKAASGRLGSREWWRSPAAMLS